MMYNYTSLHTNSLKMGVSTVIRELVYYPEAQFKGWQHPLSTQQPCVIYFIIPKDSVTKSS
jgi:hypothetical protein